MSNINIARLAQRLQQFFLTFTGGEACPLKYAVNQEKAVSLAMLQNENTAIYFDEYELQLEPQCLTFSLPNNQNLDLGLLLDVIYMAYRADSAEKCVFSFSISENNQFTK